MNKERLLNAARAVREGKPDDFFMGRYQNSCGTPACVLGHYASRMDLQSDFYLASGFLLKTTGGPLDFDGEAVVEHFDLTQDETEELFSSSGCGNSQTNEQAAKYIEGFVSRKELSK